MSIYLFVVSLSYCTLFSVHFIIHVGCSGYPALNLLNMCIMLFKHIIKKDDFF